jgi:hypothetical protein
MKWNGASGTPGCEWGRHPQQNETSGASVARIGHTWVRNRSLARRCGASNPYLVRPVIRGTIQIRH